MRSRIDRERDRASFLTPPYEEPNVLLAQAIRELCCTIDDAAQLIATALEESSAAVSHRQPQYIPARDDDRGQAWPRD